MSGPQTEPAAVPRTWRVTGTYFEACNCDAICPCRSVRGAPSGPSTYGVCYGTLSWLIEDGRAGTIDLSDLRVVLSLRYRDDVRPSTRWELVLYVDERADADQQQALADIFLGRVGGTVAAQYGPAIGEVRGIRAARITLEHVAPRKRIDVGAAVGPTSRCGGRYAVDETPRSRRTSTTRAARSGSRRGCPGRRTRSPRRC